MSIRALPSDLPPAQPARSCGRRSQDAPQPPPGRAQMSVVRFRSIREIVAQLRKWCLDPGNCRTGGLPHETLTPPTRHGRDGWRGLGLGATLETPGLAYAPPEARTLLSSAMAGTAAVGATLFLARRRAQRSGAPVNSGPGEAASCADARPAFPSAPSHRTPGLSVTTVQQWIASHQDRSRDSKP